LFAPTPTPTPTPPVIVLRGHWQTLRPSKKKTAKVLVVNISGTLDPASAQVVSDYNLVSPGKDKKLGTRDDKTVVLTSATYDPVARAVTLTPKGRVPTGSLQLTIKAAGTLDAHQQPIDGNRDGQSGGDFQSTFKGGGITLASDSPIRSSRRWKRR
jgi:hypothetical protein